MEGKFTMLEKFLLVVTLILIIVTLIIKSVIGTNNTGAVVAYGFFAIMVYFMLLIASLFPATWRMTSSQREEIKDLDRYQSKYRFLIVMLDFVIGIFFNIIILAIC